jgi:hypothetical protein
MAKKSPLIPFSMTPASWGLKGDSRRIAEAEYIYTGEELARKLAEIKFTGADLQRELARIDLEHNHIDAYGYDHKLLQIEGRDLDERALLELGLKHQRITEYEFDKSAARLSAPKGRDRQIALLAVELKHDRIEQYDHDVKVAELLHSEGAARERAMLDIKHSHSMIDDFDYEVLVAQMDHADGKERDIAVLAVQYRHGKIDSHQMEKEAATLEERPWVRVIDSGFDPDQGPQGVYFEFDWNEYMILYLRMNGYTGPSEAAIIDNWFTDLCRAQGLGATNGGGGGFGNDVVPFRGTI